MRKRNAFSESRVRLVLSFFPILLISASLVNAQAPDVIQREWNAMHVSKQHAMHQFNEAKFGMFIHWGVYSVPAGIWNGEKIPGLGEWILHRAQVPRDTYKALCRKFNPVKFDAESWVRTAKEAGMRYIVAMPKHHDGFAMYDSKVTDYDIVEATPFRRDPIMELYTECRKQGLKFGIYYSHATDWMDGGDAGVSDYRKAHPELRDSWPANTWDPAPVSFEEYLRAKAVPQVRELLALLPGLQEIWYDVPKYMTREQSFRFYKLAYDAQSECLINSRVGNDLGDFWIPGDNKIPHQDQLQQNILWETPGTLNNTWGYKSYDVDWKSVRELIYWIVEIASKGGNYLLNVGPMADGTIPRQSIDQLREVGQWMRINGEAIYGTRRWEVNKEGPTSLEMSSTTQREKLGFTASFSENDFWFTATDHTVYAISLAWPAGGKALISSLRSDAQHIRAISMLGDVKDLPWGIEGDHVYVQVPVDTKPSLPHGYVLKVVYDQ